jgi:hypothetical protein
MNQNYEEESVKNMSLVVIMENVKGRRKEGKGEGEKGRKGEREKGRRGEGESIEEYSSAKPDCSVVFVTLGNYHHETDAKDESSRGCFTLINVPDNPC